MIVAANQRHVNAGVMHMATVLFAGFGDLGSVAGRQLADAGLRVIALKRTPAEVGAGIELHTVDLAAPFTLPPALGARPDAVVIAVSPQAHDRAGYEATYIGAVRHTLAAVRATGAMPRLLLFVSSTGVWPESGDLWLSEDTPARPDSWNGEIMLRAEQLVLDSGLPATTLRLGGIYGPGRYMLVRKAQAILDGRTPWPAPAWTNRIHRDDAARMIAFLINRALGGVALDRVYTGVDNEPALNVDVLRFILREMQARAVDDIDLDDVSAANVATGGKRIGNARIRTLGFQFRFPDFRSGYRDVLSHWKTEQRAT